MRFRVWDKREKRMNYNVRVTTTDDYKKVEAVNDYHIWKELYKGQYELMQSTGLVDENGEEIFEGDILTDEGSFENDGWDYATIEFDETDYTYYLDWKNEEICQSITECKNYSVAGNIYENKDLLDDEKDYFGILETNLNELARMFKTIEEEKKTMNFEELKTKVEKWAEDKDLLHSENADKQFMKFVEEVFEFKTEMDFYSGKCEVFSSVSKNLIKDEMGDVFVTLIILCNQLGIDCVECLDKAYEKISKRKGKTVNGLFVKEKDL
ncbi:hypothetical protein ERM19_15425 [Clostridioides difficile]|nr:hypothetical protein [Clostridioides difficile]